MRFIHKCEKSESGCFFECAVRYVTADEETAKLVRKTGVIAVLSDWYQYVESKALESLGENHCLDEDITAIKKAKYDAVVYTDKAIALSNGSSIPEGCLPFYVSLQFETFNELTGKTSKESVMLLVVAKDILDAKSAVDTIYKDFDYTITSVKVSKVFEIILPNYK